jgi:hypothetical protein
MPEPFFLLTDVNIREKKTKRNPSIFPLFESDEWCYLCKKYFDPCNITSLPKELQHTSFDVA